jgi:hypothetical protein
MELEQTKKIESLLLGADHWSDLEPMLDEDDLALLRIELDNVRPRRVARTGSARMAGNDATRLAA